MRTPVATYRIQFHQGFRFVDGRDLVPYLNELGITDLYSSPRFKARRGSSHGYDIANPMRINSELGTEEDFDELTVKLRHYGMGLLLDVVPNHMAASSENPWWRDVLENGPSSEFASYFDINWYPPTTKSAFLHENKVLLPILGDLYGNVLHNQEFALKIQDTGFFVRYYERQLPLNLESSRVILERSMASLPAGSPAHQELRAVLDEIERMPPPSPGDPQQSARRRGEQERIKERLWQAYLRNSEIRQAVDDTLRVLAGVPGDPASFDALDQILDSQSYRMAYWKVAYEEINYRRFFDINDLVGLRVERPEVFEQREARLLELVKRGKVHAVRVDHVDGLFDPREFLERLERGMAGEEGGFYIAVEKVLGRGETLPEDWSVAGTTGYDFLNAVNDLYIHPQGLVEIERIYRRRTGESRPFAEICYACNKHVMEHLFPGEMNGFAHELGRLAAEDRQARDIPLSELMEVLKEVTACLPIYRTYIRSLEPSERDRAYLEKTFAVARARTPEYRVSSAAFEFLRRVLLLDPPEYERNQQDSWLSFLMRWQQFTGPVMGKGLEDTAFYRHNALISMNEVGSDPLREEPPMDLAAFHEFNRRRLARWPHAMNATSTHDSKRSEDLRARINVLSEIPSEWEQHLDEWMRWNASRRRAPRESDAPVPAEEILVYQTLLGAWPLEEADLEGFADRLKEFVVKAAREAKLHTSWLSVNRDHENALCGFVDAILDSSAANPFPASFHEFRKKLAYYGAINALGQVLLKATCPGVPDFYQGTEFWNLTLVDPDNRRPVDYRKRIALLEQLQRREAEDRASLLEDLIADWQGDGIKMYLTYRTLAFRRAHAELFLDGDYQPLWADGPRRDHICAFARNLGERWFVTVVPRWLTRLDCRPPRVLACGWGSTALAPPAGAPGEWFNVLTGQPIRDWRIAEILHDFPVALLAAGV